MTLARQSWIIAGGVIGYAIVYPWVCHLLGAQPWGPWGYAAAVLALGCACTAIRKLAE